MSNVFARWGRMAAGAAALAILAGWTTSARADYAYAYSEQLLSGLRISGTASGAITGTTTLASATINGSGPSNSNPVNTPQAYTGIPGTPAEDQYNTKFVTTFVPGPSGVPPTLPAGAVPTQVTPAAGGAVSVNNFARGDAAYIGGISTANLFGTGITVANVAEAYVGTGNGTGTGSFVFSATFTTGATQALADSVGVAFTYANDLFASVTPTGGSSANASFQFGYTIKNVGPGGTVVYDFQAASAANAGATNRTTGAPPNGNELLSSGSVTPSPLLVTAGSLAPNTSYQITFSGQEQVSVFAPAAVPAPTSIVMLGLGLGGLGLFRFRNRRVVG